MSDVSGDLLPLLQACGALRPGLTHFRNGLLGDGWIEKGEIMRDPAQLDRVAAWQAQAIAGQFPGATLLVGAPACGAVLAAFVARHLGLPVAFLTLQPAPAWHRMHVPAPGHRAVYVDDLICTGRDARTASAFLRAQGLTVLGVSAWISRTDLGGEQLHTLAPPPFQTWAAHPAQLAGPPRYTNIRE
ncbi:orotate phosphoribosyltransferase [Deinococcus multiflagellatus]|uniref:Orotate phosphoribosyltransferase n=1 Tax=Deinococcus multiflagellatus TaxID=1656887 RepID=A0ABW1ZLL7_9DEIO|nr:orotate phosphoribosyltransferase [Deinococcus multiflagellatus]MBZ9713368.1 orotate phosphoribosyltransferase [Deinococcus multiflagellatus]